MKKCSLPGISDDIFWIHIFGLERNIVQLEPTRFFFGGGNTPEGLGEFGWANQTVPHFGGI